MRVLIWLNKFNSHSLLILKKSFSVVLILLLIIQRSSKYWNCRLTSLLTKMIRQLFDMRIMSRISNISSDIKVIDQCHPQDGKWIIDEIYFTPDLNHTDLKKHSFDTGVIFKIFHIWRLFLILHSLTIRLIITNILISIL